MNVSAAPGILATRSFVQNICVLLRSGRTWPTKCGAWRLLFMRCKQRD